MFPGLYDFQLSLKIVLLLHQLDPETTFGAEYPCRPHCFGHKPKDKYM
jgi:hypothetical protein